MFGSCDIFVDLVVFDIVSCEFNLVLIDYVCDYLVGFGVDSELFFDVDGCKVNFYVIIGFSDCGGVCFFGYIDVVLVDGQVWSVLLFWFSECDGCFYGCGMVDMKGYLVCVLVVVLVFFVVLLCLLVYLVFFYDEEVGCLGVCLLFVVLEWCLYKLLLCIIGEFIELKLVFGYKGKLVMCCEVYGVVCYLVYVLQGVNVIEYVVWLIGCFGEIGVCLVVLECYDWCFDLFYLMVQIGLIQGGWVLNIVFVECCFDFEVCVLLVDELWQVVEEFCDYVESELLLWMCVVE